eukprot:12910097-Prorocentrum_lima.AAC.1
MKTLQIGLEIQTDTDRHVAAAASSATTTLQLCLKTTLASSAALDKKLPRSMVGCDSRGDGAQCLNICTLWHACSKLLSHV